MNILKKIIATLNKEESRFYKLFASRTNSKKERKDVLLFDYIKRHNEDYDEGFIAKKLYKDNKNAFYQLKNRLFKDLNKSMMLQHLPREKDIQILQFVLLSRVYKRKGDIDLSFYYLKKAESKALEIEAFELLAIIYAEIIKLSYDIVSIDVEEYIAKQKENKLKLDQIQEIDQILAAASYRIKTAQNFSGKNDAVLNVLEKAVKEFAKNKDIPKSPKFRFKVYLTISRILLQKHDFAALEDYLLHTYKEFTNDKIFNKTNHEHKLMMLIYLTNCLYKRHKLKKSLEFAEILKKGMDEYGGFLRDKFLFYYYNALVINYSVLNKKEALKILEEARRSPIIKQLPTYTVFIYLNTALIYFDQGKYRMAIKNLSRLLLHDDFVDIGKSFQFKIYIASLIIRFELGDFDTIESRLKYIQRVYKEILENEDFKRDIQLIEIISKLIYCNNLQQDKKLLAKINTLIAAIDDDTADDVDVINYNLWLKSKL
ncbi:MAG: hypothetical protein CL872_03455 [Dehalococcoidaceae bacterium]|nr:hypothetical protein [Dehalococcoidaceae bacterium]